MSVPSPKTTWFRSDVELWRCLDGQRPEGFDLFESQLKAAGKEIGYPCFLRTGHTSGKRFWSETCYCADESRMLRNAMRLVEWSHLCGLTGLPHDVWAVRELLKTKPLGRLTKHGDMPIVEEYRVFVHSERVQCVHSYWTADAIEAGAPSTPCLDDVRKWEKIPPATIGRLGKLARSVVKRLPEETRGDYWSVDFLRTTRGWAAIDMAAGEVSWHWPTCRFAAPAG